MISELISLSEDKTEASFLLPCVLLLILWHQTANHLYLALGTLGLMSFGVINGLSKVLARRATSRESDINENMENAADVLKNLKNSRTKEKYAFYLFSISMLTLIFVSISSMILAISLIISNSIQSILVPVILLVVTIWLMIETYSEAFMTQGYRKFVLETQKIYPGKNFFVNEEE